LRLRPISRARPSRAIWLYLAAKGPNCALLNWEYFIAKRILYQGAEKRVFSAPVVQISTGAIALGMVVMIVALATGNGLRQEIRHKLTGFSGDIQILHYQPGYAYEQKPLQVEPSVLAQIERLPGLRAVQPFARKAGILKHEAQFEGAVLKGVDAHYDWRYFKPYLMAGRFPQIKGSSYSEEVLISAVLSRRLRLQPGDTAAMYFVRPERPPLLRYFKVAGVFQTDFAEIDQNFMIGDLKQVQRLSKWEPGQVGGYELFAERPLSADALQALRRLLPVELDAQTAEQLYPQIFQWVKLFDINIVIILLIMVVVAAINMCIALLTIILERTTMIGLLKALGATHRQVRRIFLTHAALLVGRGMLWGNVIGVGLCLLQMTTGVVKLDPETYYVSRVAIELNLWHIVALNAGTLVLCVLALLLPAMIITRITPVKAIRFD